MEFCIRLDDACPQMSVEKWGEMENILEKHGVKPIVGIIPDNWDEDFKAEADRDFWNKAIEWQNKGWCIALHGLHHKLDYHEPKGYYQLSHSRKTEWAGKKEDEQFVMLEEGYDVLIKHGLIPKCFFAPCHTFDIETIRALRKMREHGKEMFVSDGYAMHPYRKDGIDFLPTLFDTPHKLPINGIYTFVYHPNNMEKSDFEYLEEFLFRYKEYFKSPDMIMKDFNRKKSQGIIGKILEISIFVIRGIKGSKE